MKHWILLCSILFLVSCSFNELPSGAVAKVNDNYITLDELQDRYDIQTMHIGEVIAPTLDEIYKDYTETLTDMILELVLEQELKKNDIEVTDAEVLNTITRIKSDYSEESFKEMLAERYIDLNSWKKQIRAGLIEDAFMREIIAAKIQTTALEIQTFYESRKETFFIDAQLVGYGLSSHNRKSLLNATRALEKKESVASVKARYKDVQIEKINTEITRIPQAFVQDIKKIPIGKATKIHSISQNEYMTIFIQEKTKRYQMSLREGLLIAERELREEKSRALYKGEAEALLKKSHIEIAAEFKEYIDKIINEKNKKNITL